MLAVDRQIPEELLLGAVSVERAAICTGYRFIGVRGGDTVGPGLFETCQFGRRSRLIHSPRGRPVTCLQTRSHPGTAMPRTAILLNGIMRGAACVTTAVAIASQGPSSKTGPPAPLKESATVPEARKIVRRATSRDQFLDCCLVLPSRTSLGSPALPLLPPGDGPNNGRKPLQRRKTRASVPFDEYAAGAASQV